jgi:hypothetical protein
MRTGSRYGPATTSTRPDPGVSAAPGVFERAAASLCAIAAEAGASLVIVNRDPTPYDTLAVRESCPQRFSFDSSRQM